MQYAGIKRQWWELIGKSLRRNVDSQGRGRHAASAGLVELVRTMREFGRRVSGFPQWVYEQSSPVGRYVVSALAILREARIPPGNIGILQDSS